MHIHVSSYYHPRRDLDATSTTPNILGGPGPTHTRKTIALIISLSFLGLLLLSLAAFFYLRLLHNGRKFLCCGARNVDPEAGPGDTSDHSNESFTQQFLAKLRAWKKPVLRPQEERPATFQPNMMTHIPTLHHQANTNANANSNTNTNADPNTPKQPRLWNNKPMEYYTNRKKYYADRDAARKAAVEGELEAVERAVVSRANPYTQPANSYYLTERPEGLSKDDVEVNRKTEGKGNRKTKVYFKAEGNGKDVAPPGEWPINSGNPYYGGPYFG